MGALRKLVATLVVTLCLGAAHAQTDAEWEAFDTLATAVERDLELDVLTSERYERLRADLAEWRDLFLTVQNQTDVRVEALQAQLTSLGPAPAEGETEPDLIAQRREELSAALEEARAPLVEAEEAYARADALIGRIDSTLRIRQTDEFLELERTPLDPALWPRATRKLARIAEDVVEEIADNATELRGDASIGRRLPLILALLVLAAGLIARGPAVVERLSARIENRSGENGRIVYGFLASLGAILAPLIAVSLINVALISSGMLGETGQAVAIGVNAAIIIYAVSRWLGTRIFPERDFIASPLHLEADQRAQGRFLFKLLGVFVGITSFIRVLDRSIDFEPGVRGVIALVFLLALGFILWRVSYLIREGVRDYAGDENEAPGYALRLLGRAVQVIAVVGPLAALVGYTNFAIGTLIPAAMTLGLLAFLATLHFVLRAAYALIRGLSAEEGDRALIPVLLTFTLFLASIPVLGLIWGMRATEILEVWNRFKAGFQIGETTISPGDFLTFALIFALVFMLVRLSQGILRQSVMPRTSLDKGGQNAIVSGVGYVGVTLAALAGITAAGIDLSSFAIIIGALGVGIGFGLQNIVNNFVSGIILLIERPISEGDWIEVNGQMGYVKAISVRSTRIETFDRTDVIVPNGDFISGTVTNWTRGNSIGRVIVPVGVAYGTDTRKVEAVLMEVAKAHPIVSVEPAPVILFRGFGADSLNFEIRAILTDVNYLMPVTSDLNHEIARRFAEEGIEIPFAQRDIWLRNPEALTGGTDEPSGLKPSGQS